MVMTEVRRETDSLGVVEVPADKLWGPQTQRSLEHFGIGRDLIPREMINAYAILKKAAANANHAGGRLDDWAHRLIVQACDEILAGQHYDMFPLHVWMTGSGTQFNMNVNEVVSNRCCQLAGTALGSKTQRPCEYGAVVERFVSLGDVHCRGGQRKGPASAGRRQHA
jgi:fumarate hydratase, class II